ncbi:hypothetical protein D3C75_620420 [compost metagenome]|jgi:hypothetical protein|uniref:Uncharacterized protein n=1 Tax=Silvania confinis TaxID=2926470 RepID=A0A9J6QFX0_9ENTR|nr:hypothetical protein [Silvania confinis]MCU6671391.1 hypothetical protein [Silvania confinis]
MRNVLVFFNNEPVIIQKVIPGTTSILREYPNGEEAHLKIMFAGVHSITGDHTEFCVASDKELTSQEIVEAANRLLK